MRISDWSSDVCSSDLARLVGGEPAADDGGGAPGLHEQGHGEVVVRSHAALHVAGTDHRDLDALAPQHAAQRLAPYPDGGLGGTVGGGAGKAAEGDRKSTRLNSSH